MRSASKVCTGKPLSLAKLKEEVWAPFMLTRREYERQCSLNVTDDLPPAPAPAEVISEDDPLLMTISSLAMSKGSKAWTRDGDAGPLTGRK